MATFLERAAHLVKRMFSLYYVYLKVWLFPIFGFDGKTMFLIEQFLVIAHLLLYYHVVYQIAHSEHPFVNL